MFKRPLKKRYRNTLLVLFVSTLGSFGYVVGSGYEARLAAVEQRPISVQPYPTTAPTLEPTASPSATIAPTSSIRFVPKAQPTISQ